MNLCFFSFTPKTIVPPLVLAKAENGRQNSGLGKPPKADLYPTSEFSFNWSFKAFNLRYPCCSNYILRYLLSS